jgi:hypothetical protein
MALASVLTSLPSAKSAYPCDRDALEIKGAKRIEMKNPLSNERLDIMLFYRLPSGAKPRLAARIRPAGARKKTSWPEERLFSKVSPTSATGAAI